MLIFARFCSQINQLLIFLGKWWFLSRIDRKFTTSVGRAHAIQKCADIDFFSGNILYYSSTSFHQNAFCFVSLRNLSNIVLAHPFQERHEGSEALSVLGVAQLIHQTLGFFLGELLTQVGQQPEEIFAKHGLVGVFVVQLQDLNEIVDATGVLGVLGLLEEGIHVLEDNGLLALLLLTTNFSNSLHGGVQVAGTNEVTNVETIDLAISLEVIDLEGELDFFNIPGVDAVFLSYFLIGCHFSSS